MNLIQTHLFAGTLPLAYRDGGSGPAFLLLHGGAGPGSMTALAERLLATGKRVVIPTYPGFNRQPRPEWFGRISDLTAMTLALIERLGLGNVTVVGNSVGGWLAAEVGLCHSPHVARLVLIGAVGLDPTLDGGGIVDPAAVSRDELLSLSFHDPSSAPRLAGPDAMVMLQENQRALRVYAGKPFMHDPALRGRLPGLKAPTLVLWGESDRISTTAYGRQFVSLIPDSRFEIVRGAGHMPQVERPDAVNEAIAAP